jgi:uncharacterized protein YabE (DUF348 family)/3D (Asp-Asp-Asp) domain-containing protein
MKPKHPLIIILTVMVSLLIGGISIIQLLFTEVVLVDGDRQENITTLSKDIKGMIREQSLALKPLDEVYPSEETRLSEGLRVVIKRFKPILVRIGDSEVEVYQRNLTAKEILRRAGVMLGGKDKLNVSLDRVIKSGEILEVSKEEKTMVTVDQEIPFKNSTVKDKDLDPGERRIEQFGEMGIKRAFYEITRIGGEELSRVLVKTEVVSLPVNQIMYVGPAYKKPTASMLASTSAGLGQASKTSQAVKVSQSTKTSQTASSGRVLTTRSKNFSYKNSYVMIATAYDLSYASTGKLPGMPDYGITASGTQAKVGTVAVDPSVIPLGTKLYIENEDGTGSYGFATAEDKGSAIKGYRVDLFYNTYQECIEFGRRRVIVYILD